MESIRMQAVLLTLPLIGELAAGRAAQALLSELDAEQTAAVGAAHL